MGKEKTFEVDLDRRNFLKKAPVAGAAAVLGGGRVVKGILGTVASGVILACGQETELNQGREIDNEGDFPECGFRDKVSWEIVWT